MCRVLVLIFAFVTVLANGAPAASSVVASIPSSLNTDPHLVGWWKFDETSGTQVTDSSKQAHTGSLEGDFSLEKASVPGPTGRAAQFDGKLQWVRVTGFKGVTGTQARTMAAWIRTSTPAGEIVSWGRDEHGQMWQLKFIRERIGVTPKGGYLYMKAGVHDGTWHHIAIVVNDAAPPNLHDHVQLFKDGVPAEIDDIGLLDLWPIETGDKLDVSIGRGFQGAIGDLRIYDRALSEDEIRQLAKTQAHPPSRGSQ
jgi:hypothetical protein